MILGLMVMLFQLPVSALQAPGGTPNWLRLGRETGQSDPNAAIENVTPARATQRLWLNCSLINPMLLSEWFVCEQRRLPPSILQGYVAAPPIRLDKALSRMGGNVCFPALDIVTGLLFIDASCNSLYNPQPSTADQDGPDQISVACWNVGGLVDRDRITDVRRCLRDNRVDVALMQETKWDSFEVEDRFYRQSLFPGADTNISGHPRSGGLLTVHLDGIQDMIRPERSHPQAQWQSSIINSRFLKARLINVYAPNSATDRHEMLDDLLFFLDTIEDNTPIILAGDFNFVADPRLDRLTSDLRDGPSQAKIRDICHRFGLVDIWRHLRGDVPGLTWSRSIEGRVRAARLDRIYVPTSLLHRITGVELISSSISDHLPVKVTFLSETPVGPPRFILNHSILQEQHAEESITSILDELQRELEESTEHGLLIWMRYKKRLQRLLRCLGKVLSRRRRRDQIEAERRLGVIETRLAREPSTAALITEFRIAARSVDAHRHNLARFRQRAMRRSWRKVAERCNKPFFRLAQVKAEPARIASLKGADGQLVTESEGVLGVARDFYASLYAAEPVDPVKKAALVVSVRKQFSEEASRLMDREVTAAEMDVILRSLPNDKAPGPDGLSYELFKKWRTQFALVFARVLQDLLTDASPIESRPHFSSALITLLPKKGDLAEMKNWRPISLANADYKVLMAALTSRLAPHIGSVVGEEQTGFIPGRSIFDPIRAVKVLTKRCKYRQKGMMLLLDMEKAYDRVSHDYLFTILGRFGMPPSWIRFLTYIYGYSSSKCFVNRFLSESLTVGRGVRQGCPFSPFLFALAIEPLAAMIRSSPGLKGLKMDRGRIKVALYADDTTIFVQDARELQEVERILAIYEGGSGAKVNADKTELMSLVPVLQTIPVESRFTLRPLDHQARLLGAMVGVQQRDGSSWEPQLDAIKKQIAFWNTKGLSLRGRVLIMKVMLLSRITFLLHVQLMPPGIARQVNRLLALFLWNTKRQEFVARTITQADPQAGGLGVPCVSDWARAIRTSAARRLARTESIWSAFVSRESNHCQGLFRDLIPDVLAHLRRPKDIAATLRPTQSVERWRELNNWLFQDYRDDLSLLFPLANSPLADRRVADVKFRILTNSAVLRYTNPVCPHCLHPDSSEHRFWDCLLARRERAQLLRICPDTADLPKATILLAPPLLETRTRAGCEAMIWRLHLLALHQLDVRCDPPAPLVNILEDFSESVAQ